VSHVRPSALALALLGGLVLACHAKPADGAGESVGIPACDAWLTRRDECLRRIDPGASAALRLRLDAEREEVKTAATTPDGRAAIGRTCIALLQELRSDPECR
jgi:hypothetical protein